MPSRRQYSSDNPTTNPRGFSLVELLVVIGIIAVLISMLLPALNKARQQALKVQCASNLRQCGVALLMYAQDNDGWIVPVGNWDPNYPGGAAYDSLGSNLLPATPWATWPAVVFRMTKPIPNDINAADYAPDIMRCPVDFGSAYDPNNLNSTWGGHSYVMNKHLVDSQDDVKKYGSKMGNGFDVSRVPLLGEKFATRPDYYLVNDNSATLPDYEQLIDVYKHGTQASQGANYLFMDLHVDSVPPAQAQGALDPWEEPNKGP